MYTAEMNVTQLTKAVQDVNELSALLRRYGVKPTMQRLEIAKIMLAKHQHLSAEQVLSALLQRNISVSKATVYNTLNLFAEKALLRQMVIDPDRIFYDSNAAAHYHFYNEDTGELRDLDASLLALQNLPELPENTVKCGVDVVIHLRNKDSHKP